MALPQLDRGQEVIVHRGGLDQMLQALAARGYRVVGPRVRDRSIVYDDIATTEDLPVRWTDEHEGGHYRLHRRDDGVLSGYVVGPHSWKRFLHPAVQRLWRAARTEDGLEIQPEPGPDRPFAFIAMRPCDLQAIALQDRVFLEGSMSIPTTGRGRGLSRRRQLRRVDGDRPEGGARLRPGADRARAGW